MPQPVTPAAHPLFQLFPEIWLQICAHLRNGPPTLTSLAELAPLKNSHTGDIICPVNVRFAVAWARLLATCRNVPQLTGLNEPRFANSTNFWYVTAHDVAHSVAPNRASLLGLPYEAQNHIVIALALQHSEETERMAFIKCYAALRSASRAMSTFGPSLPSPADAAYNTGYVPQFDGAVLGIHDVMVFDAANPLTLH